MKIVHINKADSLAGASRMVMDLHESLITRGIDSKTLVSVKNKDIKEVYKAFQQTDKEFTGKLLNKIEYMTSMQYSLLWPRRYILDNAIIRSADIIHLHNIHGGYFTYKLLPSLSKIAPIVWTLHDMWAFTGHCAYSFDCERWKEECGKCKNLRQYPAIMFDTTRSMFKKKREIYSKTKMTLVAPSQWVHEKAESGRVFKNIKIMRIVNGIDLDIFYPIDTVEARKILNLPLEENIILFAAANLSESRKGGRELIDIVRELGHNVSNPINLIIVGAGKIPNFIKTQNIKVANKGWIADKKKMALYYSAADVFLFPTKADIFGLVALEAIACGTPVITFNTGGVSEIVEHNKTGYIARQNDIADFCKGVLHFLYPKNSHDLPLICRKKAESQFSLERMVDQYISLYSKLIC